MSNLRNYQKNTSEFLFYQQLHQNQTLQSVRNIKKKYSQLKQCEMTMKEALSLLDNFVDPSDPDVDLPNSVHAYQTAEMIRKQYPDDTSLQITGLIHDLGKVLFQFGEPNYNIVGDTFVLGCEFSKKIVYYDTLTKNPNYYHPVYSTKYGIYKPNCGLEKLEISYGHDEYLYTVLKNNTHNLEKKYCNIIRYHSFYPWHTGGDYHYFMNENDKETLQDIIKFNSFDLYSKEDDVFQLTDKIKSYYDNLLDKYFKDKLKW